MATEAVTTRGQHWARPASTPHPIAETALLAADARGYDLVDDFTAGTAVGFGFADLNIVDGRRQSAADAYLTPARPRPGLHVLTSTTALRLILADDFCTGVEVACAGSSVQVRAERETILCADAIGSAALLLRSGVGPADQLRAVGVGVRHELGGVGAGLFDHPMSGVVYGSSVPIAHAGGNHCEAQGLLASTPGVAPDTQILFADVPLRAEHLAGPPPGGGDPAGVSVKTPHSRGSLQITVPGAEASLASNPGGYRDSRDVDVAVTALRVARDLGRAAAFDRFRRDEVQPGPGVRTTAELRRYVRDSLRSYHHYSGTCRIGRDAHAVVDTDLRVRGLGALRVADASVMPAPPSANTHATVYAVGERAAELVRPG